MRFFVPLILSLITATTSAAPGSKSKIKSKRARSRAARAVTGPLRAAPAAAAPAPVDPAPDVVAPPPAPVVLPTLDTTPEFDTATPGVDPSTGVKSEGPRVSDVLTEPFSDHAPTWRFEFGPGFDGGWRRGVNPDFGYFTGAGLLFTTVRRGRWGLGFELANPPRRATRTGGLTIEAEAWVGSSWARYAFRNADYYRGFVTFGAGRRFERVRTSFDQVTDVRRGQRDFVGLGLGAATESFKYIILETEVRVTSEEARKSPGLSLLVRAGVTL